MIRGKYTQQIIAVVYNKYTCMSEAILDYKIFY